MIQSPPPSPVKGGRADIWTCKKDLYYVHYEYIASSVRDVGFMSFGIPGNELLSIKPLMVQLAAAAFQKTQATAIDRCCPSKQLRQHPRGVLSADGRYYLTRVSVTFDTAADVHDVVAFRTDNRRKEWYNVAHVHCGVKLCCHSGQVLEAAGGQHTTGVLPQLPGGAAATDRRHLRGPECSSRQLNHQRLN